MTPAATSAASPAVQPDGPRRARGFTIVELLVVVAIIAVLMGLLVSGLRGAMASSKKTGELSLLRAYHTAWQQYADQSDEQLLPGYLDPATQTAWGVTYRNMANQTLDPSLAAHYPWRLQKGFGPEAYTSYLAYSETPKLGPDAEVAEPWPSDTTALPSALSTAFPLAGSAMALQPAFGYNAYYIGGWYTTQPSGAPQPAFAEASWTTAQGDARKGGLVATRLAHIRRTGDVIIFCSSTFRDMGNYVDSTGTEDHAPGAAWVVPPALGQQEIWQPYLGNPQSVGMAGEESGTFAAFLQTGSGWTDTGTMQVSADQCVPLRRFNRKAAVVHADGSTNAASLAELMDMRSWIDAADQPDFRHQNN